MKIDILINKYGIENITLQLLKGHAGNKLAHGTNILPITIRNDYPAELQQTARIRQNAITAELNKDIFNGNIVDKRKKTLNRLDKVSQRAKRRRR